MRGWSPARVAAAAGAELVRDAPAGHALERVVVDSRQAGPGALFVGLPGTRVDGGSFASAVLGADAWGVLVAPGHADAGVGGDDSGAVLAADDPLAALGRLARAWRRELGAQVIGVTGSTGKTTTKELLLKLLAPHRATMASRANLNTEIGLPLQILAAPEGTEVLVLEMAMRGAGQIAGLAAIAEPDVGVIVNVGPVHLELLGSLQGVAAAKAELIAGLRPGATAVIPAGEPLLDPYLRSDLRIVTFGPGGDMTLEDLDLELPDAPPHVLTDLLAAVAAARALGVEPSGRVDLAPVAGRGARSTTSRGVVVIDDCYNANPMSVRAALDALAEHPGPKLAVLGDMLELGPDEARFHAEVGAHARARGVDRLVAVGPRAAHMAEAFGAGAHRVPDAATAAELVPGLTGPGEAVLVKASNGMGLSVVCAALGS